MSRLRRFISFLIGFLSFCFWGLMLFGFNKPYIAILTVLSAIIHEAGHITALSALGGGLSLPRFVLSGFRIRAARPLSYRDELYVLIAGPLSNILSFLFFYLLSLIFGMYFRIFAIINLLTALSNLIPVEGYDGYKIINTARLLKNHTADGSPALRCLSFASVCVMTFLSLYFIMKVGDGYWVFAIFFISLIVSIFRSKNIKKRDLKRFRENS